MIDIKEICKDVSFSNLYNWDTIPVNILSNSISNLSIRNDEIILFYDSSLFGNGKTGLAICFNGLYWKNSFCPSRYLSWNSFKKIKLSYDSQHVYLGENDNFCIYQNSKELVDVLYNIQIAIKTEKVIEKTIGVFDFIGKAINFIDNINVTNNSLDTDESIINNIEDNNQNVNMLIEGEEKRRWFLVSKGLKVGPYSEEEIEKWLDNNKPKYEKLYFFPESSELCKENKYEDLYVWKKEIDDCVLVDDLKEFREFINIMENIKE